MTDKNMSSEAAQNILIPPVDRDIPLPKSATEAFPELSPKEELDVRANTIKLLAELNGQPLKATAEHAAQANELARQMIEDPKKRIEYAKYPNETLAYLAGMVAQMNISLVNDLADYKMYVVNHLVNEIENAKDSKARLTALRSLGEVDGVDAFKKRTETTIKVQSIEEVENELAETLRSLKARATTVDYKEIKQKAVQIEQSAEKE
jgi:hypothetical protein